MNMVPSAMSVISPSANGQPSLLGYPPYICSIFVRKTLALSPKVTSVPGVAVCMIGKSQIYSHHHGRPSSSDDDPLSNSGGPAPYFTLGLLLLSSFSFVSSAYNLELATRLGTPTKDDGVNAVTDDDAHSIERAAVEDAFMMVK